MLPDSFFIVSNVVLHGKCSSEKIITFMAVKMVQPFSFSMVAILDRSSILISSPFDR